MGTLIQWAIPLPVQGSSNYNQTLVYRSSVETDPFVLIDTVASGITNCPPALITSYVDNSAYNGRNQFYGVRFFDSVNNIQSQFITAYPEMTPKETRLVTTLRSMIGQTLATDPNSQIPLTDQDLLAGINLALGAFNMYPPVTCFTIDTFPCCGYETMLLYMAQLFTFLNKYLGIAINDYSYSDNGLSLNIDRGARVNAAIQNAQKLVDQFLAIVKLEFAFQGESVGTMQLPVGIGGVLSRGVSNILDVFNSMGR